MKQPMSAVAYLPPRLRGEQQLDSSVQAYLRDHGGASQAALPGPFSSEGRK